MPIEKKLSVITGDNLKIKGKISVAVAKGLKEEKIMLDLIIIDCIKDFLPLLGRNWLDVLYDGWRNFFLNVVKEEENAKIDLYRENVIQELRRNFPGIFDRSLEEPMEGFEAEIYLLDNARPIFYKAYDVPFKLREKVCKELDRLENENIIKPIKFSEWASPMVIVPKANGDIRLCTDCKVTINKVISTEHYPLPNINDMLSQLGEYEWYAKCDLTGAYQQLKVAENSKQFLTINTIKGLYQFQRLPFGVSSAASTFQRVMDTILMGFKGVQCFLDDILIGAKNLEELKRKLFSVFERLQKHKVKVNFDKCEFFVDKVKYLGHEVSIEGIRPCQEKVKAIMQLPSPQNVTQLKSFIGMLNYYSKFVPQLAGKLRIFYNLLMKGVEYEWTTECMKTFESCKKLLLENNLLHHYDATKPIVILCDACNYGVGAVLCNVVEGEEKPVFFISSTLSKAEQNYPNLHREALVMVFAATKFHKYIYGHKVTFVTDNRPLATIFNLQKGMPALAAGRLQKYAFILSTYDFEVKYRKGAINYEADALSRLPIQGETGINSGEEESNIIKKIVEEFPLDFDKLGKETQKDELLNELYRNIKFGWGKNNILPEMKYYFANNHGLSIFGDCIMYLNRVIVPEKFRKEILKVLHEGHMGIVRMKHLARRYVYWRKIDDDIEKTVKLCDICNQEQNARPKTYHAWPTTTFPFERVHLDLFYFGGKTFLVFVDDYSKWIEVKHLRKGNSWYLINALNSIFSVFGLAKTFVSDNGPPFGSYAFLEFCSQNGINVMKSPPYRPESNGLAERGVQTIKHALKKFSTDPRTKNKSILELIELILKHYRSSHCTSIKSTPSEMIFSYKPRILMDKFKPNFEKHENQTVVPLENKENYTKNYSKKKNNFKELFYKINEVVWYKLNENKWVIAQIVKINSNYTYYIKYQNMIRLTHKDNIRKKLEKKNDYILRDTVEPNEFKTSNFRTKRLRSNTDDQLIENSFCKKPRYFSPRKSKRTTRKPDWLTYTNF